MTWFVNEPIHHFVGYVVTLALCLVRGGLFGVQCTKSFLQYTGSHRTILVDEVGDGEGNVSLGVVQMHLMMKEVRRRKKGELEGRKDEEGRRKKEGGRRKAVKG